MGLLGPLRPNTIRDGRDVNACDPRLLESALRRGQGPMVGVIVLAAYRPSKELFARQLASIRDQTVTDWECIISVDGELETVEEVLADVAAGDERFRILADGRRLGFYLNFE